MKVIIAFALVGMLMTGCSDSGNNSTALTDTGSGTGQSNNEQSDGGSGSGSGSVGQTNDDDSDSSGSAGNGDTASSNTDDGDAGTGADNDIGGLWGDCTGTDDRGFTVVVETEAYGSEQSRVLYDGCASDTEFLTFHGNQSITVPNATGSLGLLVWLAEYSGVAEVYLNRPFGIESELRAIHPAGSVTAPVYIAGQRLSDADILRFQPLDTAKPVKITEVRRLRAGESVNGLRKLHFSDVSAFVAMNGDVRARVTAHIASLAGGVIVSGEGWGPGYDTCGDYRWIDATGEISSGLIQKGSTVWLNFDLVSNAEIASAMRSSWQSGVDSNYPYYTCARADDSLADQDWLGKAEILRSGGNSGEPVVD